MLLKKFLPSAMASIVTFSGISLAGLPDLGIFEQPSLPSLSCHDTSSVGIEHNWVKDSGCHYSDVVSIPYIESDNDIGVKLFLPTGVDAENGELVTQSLKKVIVYIEGWNNSTFSVEHDGLNVLDYYRNSGVSVLSIIPGKAGDDGTIDFSNKIKSVLTDLENVRNSIPDVNDIVVLGYSIGGVSGRLALAEMENSFQPHGASLFISYDAPNTGLSTPQSMIQLIPAVEQYLIDSQNFIDDQNPVIRGALQGVHNDLQGFRDGLYDNPVMGTYLGGGVFKDLLNDNIFDTELTRENLIEKLDEAGYPSTRNIAVSNGSLSTPAPIESNQPGNSYYNFSGRTHGGVSYAYFNLNLLPTEAGQPAVSMNMGGDGTVVVTAKCFFFFTCKSTIRLQPSFPRKKYSPSDVMELDRVPGSYITNAPLLLTTVISEFLGPLFPYNANHTNSDVIDISYSTLLKVLSLEPLTAQDIAGISIDESLADSNMRYTFVPTASAFGLPAESDISMIQNAYDDPMNLSPFDVLISVAENLNISNEPTENLVHTLIVDDPEWTNEINTVFGLPAR